MNIYLCSGIFWFLKLFILSPQLNQAYYILYASKYIQYFHWFQLKKTYDVVRLFFKIFGEIHPNLNIPIIYPKWYLNFKSNTNLWSNVKIYFCDIVESRIRCNCIFCFYLILINLRKINKQCMLQKIKIKISNKVWIVVF